MKTITVLLLLFGTLLISGCKKVPTELFKAIGKQGTKTAVPKFVPKTPPVIPSKVVSKTAPEAAGVVKPKALPEVAPNKVKPATDKGESKSQFGQEALQRGVDFGTGLLNKDKDDRKKR